MKWLDIISVLSLLLLLVCSFSVTAASSEPKFERSTAVDSADRVGYTGEWFNSSWEYRKEMEISGPIEDYQMKLNVSYDGGGNVSCEGNVNEDFSDLRFTAADGVSTRPYWIEERVNGSYAVTWIKTSGEDSMYMYYGNSEAVSKSNGTETFIAFNEPIVVSYGDYTTSGTLITFENVSNDLDTHIHYKYFYQALTNGRIAHIFTDFDGVEVDEHGFYHPYNNDPGADKDDVSTYHKRTFVESGETISDEIEFRFSNGDWRVRIAEIRVRKYTSPEPAWSGFGEETTPSSEFEVEVIDYDEEVAKGEEVSVVYTVTNTGIVEDTQMIEFCVGGQVEESEKSTLAPEETYESEFTWSTDQPGEYELAISSDDDKAEVIVNVLNEYELAIDAGEGGTTEPEPGIYTYQEGEEVKIKAVSETGWIFDEWTGDVDTIDDPRSVETFITMDADHTISAAFLREVELTVDEPTGQGTIRVDGDEINEYPYTKAFGKGEEVIMSANPEESWLFDKWIGDVEYYENEIVLVMDSNKSVSALFEELDEYELTIDIEGEGTTEPSEGTHTYSEGEKITITAYPGEGWMFGGWTGDVSGGEEHLVLTMDSDKSVTAWFEIREYGLDVFSQGEGSVDMDPEREYYEHGTRVELTAVSEEDWEFDRWTGDAYGSEEHLILTMDSDKSVTAWFEEEEEPTYNLTIEVEGEGTTDPFEGTHTYEEGTEIKITATPGDGWHFVGWIGDYMGEEEEITITMDEDKELTANFEEDLEEEDGESIFYGGVRNQYWWLILVIVAFAAILVSSLGLLLSSSKRRSN